MPKLSIVLRVEQLAGLGRRHLGVRPKVARDRRQDLGVDRRWVGHGHAVGLNHLEADGAVRPFQPRPAAGPKSNTTSDCTHDQHPIS